MSRFDAFTDDELAIIEIALMHVETTGPEEDCFVLWEEAYEQTRKRGIADVEEPA